MMPKGRLSTFAILLLLCGFTPKSFACSCVEYLGSQPEQALDKSDLVFAGEVVSVEVVTVPIRFFTEEQGTFVPRQMLGRKAIVTFRVEKDWKGVSPETYAVLAGAPPEKPLPEGQIVVDCQEHFEVGKKYLVFASGEYPEADPCTPTGEFDPKDPYIKRLDRHISKKSSARPPAN